ncbi:uncharacterized protein LOC129410648 [Boleophthalmus pectinirostris]|uniref:uncharacterized protein LOC129410648 n=1 Tax=Boleophthalmus pectinirostris TaxID=150288 RepID=UPI00242BCB48|nr:uncharacterized protein LOC129410648 [Boleophthalmus pectinirostris]
MWIGNYRNMNHKPPESSHLIQLVQFSLPAETKLVKDVEFCEQRRFSTPGDHRATVHIPRGMAMAPFLKHSGLTPAQREYLYSVAATYSGDRVRDIITTHYMNILHRCIRAGHTVEKVYSLAPVTLPQMVEPPQTEVESNPNTQNKPTSSKQKGKTSIAAKNYGKTILPKINKRQPRLKTPVSKQRKKQTTPPKLKKKSPSVSTRVLSPDEDDEDEDWLKDWLDDDEEEEEKEKERRGGREEEEEEEQSLKECLSDGLSSLSLTDWDSDSDT